MGREIENCIIVGAGMGLSASLASLFRKENMNVVLAARNIKKLDNLKRELGCHLIQCDASDPTQVEQLFAATDKLIGQPKMVVYNPSARVRGEITSLDPLETKQALDITCYGAFLVAQQAAIRMIKEGSGSIFFYRRICRRERLSKFISLRNGKIRLAWFGSIASKRTTP